MRSSTGDYMLIENVQMPDVPVPDTAAWVPPSRSEYHILQTDESMSLLWSWGQDELTMIEPKVGGQVILPNANGDVPDILKRKVIALNGAPIPKYTVVSRSYWKSAGGWTIAPGDSLEFDTSYTTGVSTTDTSSWSAEIGIAGGGIEGKIGQSFSRSVMVSDTKTAELKRSVSGDPDRYTNFTLWIPVFEMVVLDENGAQLVTHHQDRTALLHTEIGMFEDQQAGITLLSTIWTMPLDHPTDSKQWFAKLNG